MRFLLEIFFKYSIAVFRRNVVAVSMRSLLFEGGSSFAFAWWSSSHLLVSVPVSLLEGGNVIFLSSFFCFLAVTTRIS